MRSIPVHIFTIVFLVMISLEIISFWGLFRSLSKSGKRLKMQFSLAYWIISVYILASFFYTFSSPDRIGASNDYRFFSFVLLLTFFNLVSKIILSFFTIVSGIISFLNKRISVIVYSAGLIITLGIMLVMVCGAWFDKKHVRIENVTVSFDSLPEQLDGFTIAQLSDVHLGSLNGNKTIVERMQKTVNKLQPDLIVFTGDMVNNFSHETHGYIDFFRKMKAGYGKFAITGNHDYGDYYHWKSTEARNKNLAATRDSIKQMGFTLLLNENRRIAVKDTAFYLIGVENWGHAPFPQYANLNKAIAGIPSSVFSVLMSHDPAHWEAQIVPQTSIPLTLSGHTHGLQFGIRIAGIEFSPMYFIEKHWGGLYTQGKQQLYVNRGLGTIGFAGRIEMRPEITILTLHRTEIAKN